MAQRQRQRQRVDQELRTSQDLAVVQNVMEVGIAGVCHYRSLFPGSFFEPAALPDGAGTVPQFCREAIRPGDHNPPSTQTTSGSGVSASRLSSSQPCSMSPITSSILETQTSRSDSVQATTTCTDTDVTRTYPTAGSCVSEDGSGGEVAAVVDEYEQLKAEARLLLQWLREGVGTAMKDGVLTRVVFGICSTSASSSPSSASYRTDQDRGGCDDGRGSRREHSSKRRRTEGRSTDHLIESYAFDIIHGSNTRRQRRGRGGNRAQVQNAAQALFRNLNGLTSALPPLLHVSCTAASIGGGDDLSAVAAGPFSQTSQFGGTSPLIPPSSRYLTLRVEFSPTAAAAAGASPAALYLPNFYGVERAAARPDEGHATIGWGGLGGLSPTTVGRVGDESGVALKVEAFGPGGGGLDVPSAERGGVDASPPTKANTTSSAAKSQRGGGIDSSPSDSADAACPIWSENENESQTSQCTNTDAMGFSEKSPQGWSIDSSAADCDGDRGKGNSIGSQTEDEPHDGQRTNAEAKELAEELPHKCNMDMSVSAPDSDGGIGEHPIRSAATEDAPHESRGTPTETTLSPQKPTRGYGISSSGCGDDGDKGEEKPIRSDTEDEDEGELRQRRSQGTPVETTHSPRKSTQGCSIDSTASCSGPEEEEERPVRSEAGCDEYESRPSITARSPVAGEGDESSMAILPPDAKAFAVPYGSNRRKDRGLHIPCTVLESKLEENGDVKYKVIFSCKHLRRKRMLKQWIPSERILSMEELLRTIESSMSREGHRTRLDSVSTAGPMLVSRSFVEDQVKKMGVQSKFVAAACGVLGYTVGSIEESREDDSDSGTSSELPVGGMKRCTDDGSSWARNADSDETEARPSNGRILYSYIANPIQVFF